MNDDHRLAQNRTTWDAWTQLNYESEFYDVESFKQGRSPLDDIVLAGVGDVDGKRLLHLQCHFGMDTLKWARMGAQVTGVDFSSAAISQARQLAEEIGVEAEFVESSVEAAPSVMKQADSYDVVFTSYGAISWLPSLKPWAKTIAYFLKPGGTFFVADHHPAAWIFDDDDPTPGLRYKYPYFSQEPISDEQTGNYAQPDADVTTTNHSWQHTFEEILGTLIDAGLTVTELREYDRCAWAWFPWMEQRDDGFWHMPAEHGDIPLMFSVTATKP